MATVQRRRVGIYGAATAQGAALMRIVAAHPMLDLVFCADTRHDGQLINERFPGLSVSVRGAFQPDDPALAAGLDLVFSAHHRREAEELLPRLLPALDATKLVDLSPMYRGLGKDEYHVLHRSRHPAPEWQDRFTPGICERNLRAISRASLVAMPGAAALAVITALAPLAPQGMLTGTVTATALTGTADAELSPAAPGYPTVSAGRIGDHHQSAEAASWLAHGGSAGFSLVLIPVTIPVDRGLYATVACELPRTVALGSLDALYRDWYGDSQFVTLLGRPPELRDVLGTNRVHLFIRVAGGTMTVTAALDTLGRGGATGAVEVANCMLGLPEEAGIMFGGA